MTIETLLGFRNIDSTEHLNSRLSGLIPKGIVRGGLVVPEPSSLQVRIKGNPDDDVVYMAFAKDGMMIRERAEERVLPVIAGITNVICLRAKFLESQDPIAQLEVLTLGAYESDADQDSLIRFASVTPPAGATAVLAEHVNSSFRDSIEGFRRGVIRGVVDTKVDLPATSGFPATAEINFITNDFAEGSSITLNTGATSLTYPLITPISFPVANPGVPGFSRINSSQKAVVEAVQSLTGQVTVTTLVDHDLVTGTTVRISDNTATQANRVWTVESIPTTKSFTFTAPLTIPWTGYGGSVVDSFTPALITATIAPGYTHSLIPGQQFIVTGATDQSFNGLYTVQEVVDEQQFTYAQVGYPTRDSGNGKINKVGFSLPPNAVEIGTTADITALNFQNAVRSSELDGDLKIFALGSSLQIESRVSGSIGNTYQLSKIEPGALSPNIVISPFSGGIDPNATSSQGTAESLQKGDLYVVLFGELGTIELWGYDGSIFRNMTSASAATLLDFHRRNLFVNEKHLAENEKAALSGTVGVPSAVNRFVTEQDTSVLTASLASALQGADSTPPGQSNRYLTEARIRGERGQILVPPGQDLVALPLGESWIIGPNNSATNDSLTKQFFNVVHTDTLLNSGGFTEYSQKDFTAITVTDVFVSSSGTPLNPFEHASQNGVFPRADAVLSGLPMQLFVKLSGIPNNGSATLLYSKAVKEVSRVPQADMLMGPQRVLPSVVQDLINRSKELRFNNGISVSSKTMSFPENLFWAENMQGFSFRRYVGLRPVEIRDAFSINFQAGTGTSGLVESFSPVVFSGSTLNKWTKYCLFVTPTNKIRVEHIEPLLENPDTRLAYGASPQDVDGPVLPMTDGSWLFATVSIKSNGITGTGIADLEQENLEIFSYQNSREPGADTVVGDGTDSYGQFNGPVSHLHALLHAKSGDTIRLLQGTYTGHIVIDKDDITLDCRSGAVLTNASDTVITVLAKRFRLLEPRFSDCAVAIELQPGADSFHLEKPVYDDSVSRRIKTPPVIYLTASSVSTASSSFTYQDHGLLNGARLRLRTAGILPSGLSVGTDYYVVESQQNSFKLALAKGGSPVSFLDGGTDVHTFSDGSIKDPMIDGIAVATWRVTDGNHSLWAGEFNSANGIQEAIDAASPGDTILVYSGTYSRFVINKDRLQVNGLGGSGVIINAGGSLQQGIHVTGNNNQIDNFFVTNAGIGIKCEGTYNTFGTNIQFGANVKTTVTFPETIATKHYNVYPSLTGRITTGENSVPANAVVTVGDGVSSWGDYVGRDAINLALATESAGTLIQVFRGDYRQITGDGTINGMAVVGTPGKETVIRADALRTTQCISINGSNNYFRNLYLIADNNDAEAIGLATVGIKVNGDDNYFENIEFPVTGGERIESHLKYQVISGARNRFIPHTGAPDGEISWTVGDGSRSFGDFNGSQGINAAIQALPTRPRTLAGEIFDSAGATAKLKVAKTHEIENVDLASSKFTKTSHGFVLNEPVTLVTSDTLPNPLQASPLGPTLTRYYVINPDANTFQLATIPATERASFSATSVSSSIITISSHGLVNGTQISLTTTNDLPSGLFKSRSYFVINATTDTLQLSESLGGSAVQLLDGGTGTHRIYAGTPVSLTDTGSGTHVVVSALPFNFTFDDLYRNVNISSALAPENFGSFRITEILGRSEAVLERLDGRAFSDETEVVCDIVSGAKICVLAGVYDPFTIPTSRNDVELCAWGSGSDTIIKGEADTAVLLTINGSRCVIRGFRFAGGDPVNGVAVQVNGCHNTFIGNRFETAKTYAFGAYALGNRVFDSHEAVARTSITVGTSNSRADFVGSTGQALEAAINLAAQDSHIKTVILGEGQWTLANPVTLPAGLVLQGSGEKTVLSGDGTFSAFSLDANGGQKIGNLKLSNFLFAAEGPATNVLLSDLWLDATSLDPNVSQGIVINSPSLKIGNDFAISSSGDIEKLKGVNYSFPTSQAAGANYTLTNDGSGNLTWEQSSAYLSALNDVSIDTPSSGDFLVSDGSLWVNQEVYIPSGLDTLTDVSLSALNNGQVLVFNGLTWVNQDVAGATNALNSLVDVEVSSPSAGQVLSYDGSNWSNADRTLPITEISDVSITDASAGHSLFFNGTEWVNSFPTLDASVDVSLSSPVSGQVLSFNGSEWINESIQISSALGDLEDVTVTSASSGDLIRSTGSSWFNESALVSRIPIGDIPSESQLTSNISTNLFLSGVSSILASGFTVDNELRLLAVDLKFITNSFVGTGICKVEIRQTNGFAVFGLPSLPGSLVATSAPLDLSSFSSSPGAQVTKRLSFSTAVALVPGASYYLLVRPTISSGTGTVTIAASYTMPTSDRYLWTSNNNGSTWQPAATTETELYYSFYGSVGVGMKRVVATDDLGFIDQSFLQYPIDFGGNKLSGVATPTTSSQAVNKVYVDTLVTDVSSSLVTVSSSVTTLSSSVSSLSTSVDTRFTAAQTYTDSNILQLKQTGIPAWSATITYGAGAYVNVGGRLYTSLVNSNLNNVVTNTSFWQDLGDLSAGGSRTFKLALEKKPYGKPQTFLTKAKTAQFKRSYSVNTVSNWISRTVPAFTYNSVCWSPELGIFVAVGAPNASPAGNFNSVLTSSDGVNWTTRASVSDRSWNSVCWSAELGLFVAVASSGGTGIHKVMTSPDGITWTGRTSSQLNWASVCWSPELGLFVAVSFESVSQPFMTSPDGVNWTSRSVPQLSNWTSVCWSPELGLFVAISQLSSSAMISTDGINWTSTTIPNRSWNSVCWSPEVGLFVAVSSTGTGNRVMTSPDGVNWTSRTSADSSWYSVCWAAELGLFVAVALGGTSRVMTSPDGINWTVRTSPVGALDSWTNVCWSPELGTLVAVAYQGVLMTASVDDVRGAENVLHLLSDDLVITATTITDAFSSAAINLAANAIYEVEWHMYWYRSSVGTHTYSVTTSQTPVHVSVGSQNIHAPGTPTTLSLFGANQTTALAASASMAAGNHCHIVTAYVAGNITTPGTVRLQVTSSANGVTLKRGSRIIWRRLPDTRVGMLK